MFFNANDTIFQLFWDKPPQKQSNKSDALLQTTTNSNKPSSLSNSTNSLDPFSILQAANELKASLGNNKENSDETKVETALDKLQILSFKGLEGISTPYAFEIILVNKHIRFDITQLLSKSVFIGFTPEGKDGPGVHGIVQNVKRGPISQHYGIFSIIITPRFTNLMRRINQRKFIDKTAPEIISTILSEHGIMENAENGFEFKFKETYPVREFCVQYDEQDYQFVSRLCQEEGIAYYFEHKANSHKMIFTDAPPFFPSIQEAVKFMNDTGMVADSQALKYFDVSLASRTQTASWRDFNFKTAKTPEGSSEGKQSSKGNNAVEANLEHYNYPSTGMDKARNEQLAKIQIERLRADHLIGEGYSDIPTLHSGYYITIEDHPSLDTMDAEKPWLITQIKHKGYQPQVLEAFAGASSAVNTNLPSQLDKYLDVDTEVEFPVQDQQQGYFNVFTTIPQEVPYRPILRHPKPRVLGSQTAIVTGPTGEEIYCDEYGRVKVQFHWDREGIYDENSSHWIRVASNWAHEGYGAVVIPRVGMEVKIEFLEGDPDNPIISGAIHNGVNTVPYDLPANKTRSVFKTSSSKGGIGSNEIRIEDKAGSEEIFVQSQKNYNQLTKNDHTLQVNNNQHTQVLNESSYTTMANHYIKDNMEFHHITAMDAKRQIIMNNYKSVGMSEHNSIGTVLTTQAGTEIHLKSGIQTVVDGGLSLTLKAGGQHIILNPSGIWMSMPVWTGGVPMEAMPAVPVPPLEKGKTVAATVAPAVILPQNIRKQVTNLAKADLVASPICQKIEDPTLANGDPNACALGDNCPCKQSRESQGAA